MFKKNMSPSEFLNEWLVWKYLKWESQNILEKYYASYLWMKQYQSKHYSNRLKEIINIIWKSNNKLDILDYWSWTWTESLFFASLGANVFWVDYYEEDLLNVAIERKVVYEKLMNQKINLEFQCQNLDQMFDHQKKYDIIWLNEAFHHIEPREKFIELIPHLLKKWWRIIIAEPNAYNIINQIFFFKHRWFKTIWKTIWNNWEEIIFWDERIIFPYKLRQTFKNIWIETQSERYFRVLPFNSINILWTYLEKILSKLPFMNIHYVYVWKKIK